jgi:hypothetical protein
MVLLVLGQLMVATARTKVIGCACKHQQLVLKSTLHSFAHMLEFHVC